MGQWTEEQPKKKKGQKNNFCNGYIVFFVDEKTFFFFLPSLTTESACKFENVCVSFVAERVGGGVDGDIAVCVTQKKTHSFSLKRHLLILMDESTTTNRCIRHFFSYFVVYSRWQLKTLTKEKEIQIISTIGRVLQDWIVKENRLINIYIQSVLN